LRLGSCEERERVCRAFLLGVAGLGRNTPTPVRRAPSEDVAIALGHTDGGELVRKLYGHRDQERALDRVTAAYGRTASLTQMRLV
jgi:hypothetical protein